nr:hypothetical protein [Tanacetum cinerariifolium]
MGRLQKVVLSSVFPSSGAGALEEGMCLKLPMLLATMRSFMREMIRTQRDQTSGRGVVIGISRPLSRVVTGVTVRITTVTDLTGVVAMTTTAATTTTTTLAVTTGIPATDVTKETWVISPCKYEKLMSHVYVLIQVLSNPGVPLRVTPIQFALLVDVDTKESVVELQADKKPGASGRVFAIT